MALTIGEWRRLKKITQPQLAQRCGVSITSIRFWEEHPERMRIMYIPVIAKALEVDEEDIVFLPKGAK